MAPLGDKPKRANSAPAGDHPKGYKAHKPDSKENAPAVVVHDAPAPRKTTPTNLAQPPPPVNPRLSAVSQTHQDRSASNRNSHVSTASASTARSHEANKIKTHIGPWQLGKTLGKGSSARVRLARHKITMQTVAVKIISKNIAFLSQAGSIAQLDKLEKAMPDPEDGLRRLPVTIEREIAIMKLIEHPNICKIHDVWENRNEMYVASAPRHLDTLPTSMLTISPATSSSSIRTVTICSSISTVPAL